MPRPTTLTVGRLKVRYRKEALGRTRAGVVYPRVFEGQSRMFGDYETFLKTGRVVGRRNGLTTVRSLPFRPTSQRPDQLSAEEHARACRALDRTPAGEKARELLFRFLDEDQRRTAQANGYFELTVYNPYNILEALEEGEGILFSTVKFRIYRGFPNGNIKMGYPEDRGFRYTLCLHPVTPYPNDDIALGQLLLIQNDPDEFIRAANITRTGTPDTVTFEMMYERTRRHKPLIVPHRDHRVTTSRGS